MQALLHDIMRSFVLWQWNKIII